MPDTIVTMPNERTVASPVQSYCPSEIVDIYNDFLTRSGIGSKVVFVTGIYHDNKKQAYGDWYYDVLRDRNSNQELSLMIPRGLKDELQDESLITVGGTITPRPNNYGSIQVLLKVTRVDTIQQQAVSEEDMKRAELRNTKSQKGFANVDAILEGILMKGERPKVALVFATTSITMSDFDAGKHAAEASIDFMEYRVNFSSSFALNAKLQEVDVAGFDVAALIRGGGSGIENLDDLSVLETIVNMKTPLICAVGHVEEKIFLKQIADKIAPTPNGLGQWFSDIVEKVTKTRQDSIAVITNQVKKQFQERLEEQTKQNKELQEKITVLTKQAETTQKQHSEDNKKLTEQLAEANKKNGELNKSFQDQSKAHQEQMQTLNKNLADFKKESSEQALKQGEVLKGLQKSNDELLKKNGELSRDLAKAQAEANELKNHTGKPGTLTVILAIVAVVLLILLIVK